MEKKRPNKSVGFFAYARPVRSVASNGARIARTGPVRDQPFGVGTSDGHISNGAGERGFSPIFITAALSVLVLVAALGWELNQSVQATNPPDAPDAQSLSPSSAGSTADNAASLTATSSDPISNIGAAVLNQLEGAYAQMQQAGVYSSSTAQMVGQSLAPYVTANVSYPTFLSKDLKTDGDTSYARMLQYRTDLRAAFAPLLKNTTPEYELFADYVDTKDASYLTKLNDVAQNYRDAADLTARIVVPSDAVPYHINILNAMEEFAATLDAMAAHANDPFASVALLRSYNQAENDMLTSFNALTTYYKSKRP